MSVLALPKPKAKEKTNAKRLYLVQARRAARSHVLGFLTAIVTKGRNWVLPVLGFASFTVGAWTVRPWLGLFVLGLSLFILDYGRRD